jgi:hypothetical protein
LFLRPTESLTVFLQQLRGRLSEGKDCLTVLDFVGNSRPEFESKFRALIGKNNYQFKRN